MPGTNRVSGAAGRLLIGPGGEGSNRVTGAGLRLLVIQPLPNNQRVSGASLRLLIEDSAPHAPTVILPYVETIYADWSATAYYHPRGKAHKVTWLQVRQTSDNAVVHQEMIVPDPVWPDYHGRALPLPPATSLELRVAYQDEDDTWGTWSAWVPFTTLALAVVESVWAYQVRFTCRPSTASGHFLMGRHTSPGYDIWPWHEHTVDYAGAHPDSGPDPFLPHLPDYYHWGVTTFPWNNPGAPDPLGPIQPGTTYYYAFSVRDHRVPIDLYGPDGATPVPGAYITQWIEVTTPIATTEPYAPVLSADPIVDGFFLRTSDLAPGSTLPDDEHLATRFELTDPADTGFLAPIHTFDFVAPSGELTLAAIDGLGHEQTYLIRAYHEALVGGVSAWSEAVEATTRAEDTLPDTPTITMWIVGHESAWANSSAFSHPGGVTTREAFDPDNPLSFLDGVQWQIRKVATLIRCTGLTDFMMRDPPYHHEVGLETSTTYEIRVRHFDGYREALSAWSAWTEFTTSAFGGGPGAPTGSIDCGDRSGTVVLGDGGFSHPNPSVKHQYTEWRITASSSTSESVFRTPSMGITWRQLTGGTWTFSLRHWGWDEEGGYKTSEWTTLGSCVVRERPPAPEFAIRSGRIITGDLLVSWDIPWRTYSDWVFTLEVSADNGATWDLIVDERFSWSWWFRAEGRVDGVYLVRVRAKYPAIDHYGEWSYLMLRLDRTGRIGVHYDLSEAGPWELRYPEWQQLWDDSSVIEWVSVNRSLHEGPSGLGIMAKNLTPYLGFASTHQRSVLAFPELGEPTRYEAEVEFILVPNVRSTWWAWRFKHTFLMRGGLASHARGLTSDNTRAGVLALAHSGVGGFGVPPAGGSIGPPQTCAEAPHCVGCNAYICRFGKAAPAIMDNGLPFMRFQYATAHHKGGLQVGAYRSLSPHSMRWASADIPPDDDLQRGLNMAHTRGDGLCTYVLPRYTMRQRITETPAGGRRFEMQILGPGVDPQQGWTTVVDLTADQVASIDCGYCGLAFEHVKDFFGDIGIVFTSFSISNVHYDLCEEPPEVPFEPLTPLRNPCPPESEWVSRDLYIGGTASPASVFQFGGYEIDSSKYVRALIRPNPVAPEGYGGECLFKRLVVVVEHISDITITVVPILNGERLDRYTQTEYFIGPGDRPARRRYEVPLYRAFEDPVVEGDDDDRFKYGLRGTYFTFQMEIKDFCGVGLQLPGVWLEYEVVRESQGTGVVYTEDLQRLPVFLPTGQMFLGTRGGAAALKAESGSLDDGHVSVARITSNPVSPENADGECHFKRASLVVNRWNDNDMDVTFTPFIDGEPKLPITIHYKATTCPVMEVTEINFSDYHRRLGADATERMRFGFRGAWFHAQIESPLQELFSIKGMDLDYDVVRESLRKDVR